MANKLRTTVDFDTETLARLDILKAEAKKKIKKAVSRNDLLSDLINKAWDEYLILKGYTCSECNHVLPINTDQINERNIEVSCTLCHKVNTK